MNKWASNWNDITDFTFISVISSHEMSGDMKLTEYLWPIVREIIKTAVENRQNLIVEGCYILFDLEKRFFQMIIRLIVICCNNLETRTPG